MHVRVIFREMQPYAGSHEDSGDYQGWSQRCTQGHRQGSADKRRQGKISASSRGTEIAQRQYKQRQAQPVPYQAEQPRSKAQGPGRQVRTIS